MFFFFLPVLAGNENQLLCCCHRSGEVCFPSTFIPGTSPSTVTVETRATPTLFPSMSPSFNDLSLLSFFNPLHSAYLPTLKQPMKYLENCVTSLKGNCIKAEMKNCRSTCWGISRAVAPGLLSELKTRRDCEVTRLTVSVFHRIAWLGLPPPWKNKLRHIFHQHVISPTPLEPSVNRGKQFITSDMGFPKSHYCYLSAHWVTRIKLESSKWVDRRPLCIHFILPLNTTRKGWATSKWHTQLYLKVTNSRANFEN